MEIYFFCLIIILMILIYLFKIYNDLVKINNIVQEAFSTMDIYLKKRWDLIPNLVEIVKGYSNYENETFNIITKLRANNYEEMSIENKININEQLSPRIIKIISVSENYPELKANENFEKLSLELIKIEDEIASSRKYYNGAVRELNDKIQMFPSNIISKIFNFKSANMFEVKSDERNNIKVGL